MSYQQQLYDLKSSTQSRSDCWDKRLFCPWVRWKAMLRNIKHSTYSSSPTCLHWPPSGQVREIFCDEKVLQRPCRDFAGQADILLCSDKTCNDEPSWPGDTWQTGLHYSASVQSYTLSEIVFSCQKINCCSNKQVWAVQCPWWLQCWSHPHFGLTFSENMTHQHQMIQSQKVQIREKRQENLVED